MLRRILLLVTAGAALALLAVVAPLTAQSELPGGHFLDDQGNVHEANIEAIAIAGITTGCNPEGTAYCPELELSRAQMASFLARALDLPPGSTSFDDVNSPNVHGQAISSLADAGITLGCGANLYCPWDTVTRAQMASFLARALGLPPGNGFSFEDVSSGGAHSANIRAIAAAGITLGCNADGTLYCPEDSVSRGQMASFLARGLELPVVELATRIDLLPDSMVCDGGPRSCTASVTVSSDTGYFLLEGWFYQLPYLDGDGPMFEDAELRIFVDGVPLAGRVEHPTTDFGGTMVRLGGVVFSDLATGTYTFSGEWWWEGELYMSTSTEVTISG